MKDLIAEMRKTADYKVGYLRSAVSTAIHFLEHGHVSEALENLRATEALMKEIPNADK